MKKKKKKKKKNLHFYLYNLIFLLINSKYIIPPIRLKLLYILYKHIIYLNFKKKKSRIKMLINYNTYYIH